MIWDATSSNDAEDAFRRAAVNEVVALCPELEMQSDWLGAWSEVLVEVCGQAHPDWRMPADEFGFLLARSLRMMGKPDAALDALRKWCSEDVARLCRDGALSARLEARLALQASGLLRGGRWLSMGDGCGWILDLARLEDDEQTGMELMMYVLVRRLVHELVPLWDATRGEGWLGLTGVGVFAQTGEGHGRAPKHSCGDELPAYVESVLSHAARERNWTRVPLVKKLAI